MSWLTWDNEYLGERLVRKDMIMHRRRGGMFSIECDWGRMRQQRVFRDERMY